MYDYEFYNEPSEFEMQIDEFKQSLLKCVKTDYVTEMERLRTENAELQGVKNNFEQIKKDYKSKEYQLEMERNDLARKARNERLSVLMKDMEVVMYKAECDDVVLPKCEKCDESRKIFFKTPSGKETHEMCECNKRKTVYIPEEYICTEFKINRDNNSMILWYKINPERDHDYASFSSSTVAKTIYRDGMEYGDLDRYNTFFPTKKECKKYCDWINNKKC